ncbi:MAG: hypothetical protein PHV34_12670 [Verrucomicrobiae bacterium]|nr:hypothetical protein [Verrucomicrobiae bacterium]
MFRERYPQRQPMSAHQMVDYMNRHGIDISVLLPPVSSIVIGKSCSGARTIWPLFRTEPGWVVFCHAGNHDEIERFIKGPDRAPIQTWQERPDEVIFAEPGDMTLLGVRTLEGFGVMVDNLAHRFVATTTLVAASSMV